MKRIIAIACTFFALYSYGQVAPPGRGLAIKPVTISFNLLPGQTGTSKLSITNQLNAKRQFTVYLKDWRRDSAGEHIYIDPGKDSRSCAAWITLEKTFFELGPGETQEIMIKMTLPDSANSGSEMKWGMVFLETVEEQTADQGKGVKTTINNRFRFGVHIYQTPPVVTRKEVKMIRFDSLPGSINHYRIVCENAGDVQVNCSSYVELSSLTDGKRIKLPSVEFPMFPEQKRFIDFQIPGSVPKGKYLLTGVVDAGVDVPLEAAQLTIEII